MLKLQAIKCNNGFFVVESCYARDIGTFQSSSINTYLFDKAAPTATYLKNWIFLPQKPTVIEKPAKRCVNHRYELISSLLTLPKVLKQQEVELDDDGNWIGAYAGLGPLYQYVYDTEDSLENIEFEWQEILSIDSDLKTTFKGFSALKTDCFKDIVYTVSPANFESQIIDKIIYPKPLLQLRPCKLSSKEAYDLIRNHVRTHIDGKYARINSDYDFCFGVEKVITLSENEPYTVDVNAFKKRARPKMETRYRTTRSVNIFSMSHSGYQKYPVIQGFEGDSFEDLQEKVDGYLNSLMEVINKPVKDCSCCKGTGVELIEFDINQR